MDFLTKWFKNSRTRMPAVVILLVILISAGTFYVVAEMEDNRDSYLAAAKIRQKEYTRQLANQLELVVQDGLTEDEIRQYFAEHAEVSGSSWMFLCRGGQVIFAKDMSTTEGLRESKEKDVFLKNLRSQNVILTEREYGTNGSHYLIGVVADREYILQQGNVIKHKIYMYLAVTALAMLAVMAVLVLTAALNKMERKQKMTEKNLYVQNQKLEQTGEALKISKKAESITENKEVTGYYDTKLIEMFLRKSEDPALYPMQIMFVDMVMGERYYSRDEIFKVMEGIKKHLGKYHITGEIQKGRFVVLMYRTEPEAAGNIRQQIEKYFAGQENADKLIVRICEVKEGDTPFDVYEKGVRANEPVSAV